MSMPRKKTIACPKCGRESKFIIRKSINTTHDPEMNAKRT